MEEETRMTFSTLTEFQTLLKALPGPDAQAAQVARARDATLTKPPGALGRLEELALWYCTWSGRERPLIKAPQVIIFAGNHGVTAQGVSAFPPEVTAQMVQNFNTGGAAVNQLAHSAGARMDVHALQLDAAVQDISQGVAMGRDAFLTALRAGWDAVDVSADLLVVGEMGIGNTTSAAAIAMALYGGSAKDWTGRGTGVDDAALTHKEQIVEQAVRVNRPACTGGLEVLRCLGGRELAAMAGAMVRARTLRIPMILDGFICTAAAACLDRAQSGALDHAVAGHLSSEGAHAALLEQLGKSPLLSLDMRLGEGSGATLAIHIVKAALACHSGMASFAEAGVSDG